MWSKGQMLPLDHVHLAYRVFKERLQQFGEITKGLLRNVY